MAQQRFERGILTVFTENIYFFMMSSLAFFLSTLPTLIWLLLLERSLLDVLALIMIGPSLTAIFRHMIDYIETDPDKDDFPGFPDFFQTYNKNFRSTLKFWSIFSVIIYILWLNLTLYAWQSEAIAVGMNILYIIFIVMLALIATYALVINSKFEFNLKSLFNLSVFYLVTTPKGTLGIAAILFLMFVTGFFISTFFLFLLSSLIAYLIVRYSYSMIDDIVDKFIEKNEEPEED